MSPVGVDVFNLNHTIVFFYDFFYDRKSKPRTFEFGGNVGFKRMRSDVLGKPLTVVAQTESYTIFYHFCAHGDNGLYSISQSVLGIFAKDCELLGVT